MQLTVCISLLKQPCQCCERALEKPTPDALPGCMPSNHVIITRQHALHAGGRAHDPSGCKPMLAKTADRMQTSGCWTHCLPCSVLVMTKHVTCHAIAHGHHAHAAHGSHAHAGHTIHAHACPVISPCSAGHAAIAVASPSICSAWHRCILHVVWLGRLHICYIS